MNGHSFIVDINSIDTTRKQMNNTYNELIQMIDKYKQMIENTEKIYNTESGIKYRNAAVIYVELIKKYMNNDLKAYIDTLDSVKNLYVDLYDSINNSTNGEAI